MANPYRRSARFRLVDTGWLHMGLTENQTMIGGVLLLEQPVSLEALQAVVRARLLRLPRFRRRVREPRLWFTQPAWEDDPDFDLDAHVRAVTLPPPGDWAALRGVWEDLMGRPLHPQKPLWQMDLVEDYQGGSALILRFEHAVADGRAAMHILDVISDPTPQAGSTAVPREPEPSLFLGTIAALYEAAGSISSLAAGALDMAGSPLHTAREGVRAAEAFWRVTLCPPDPQTVLRGRRSTAQRLAVAAPLTVAEIKAVGRPLGATVNDVILSAVAGSFRRYLQARGEPVDQLSMRATVPVNIRDQSDVVDLGNGFGLDFLPLPIDVADPVARLQALKGRMDALKGSAEAQVTYRVLQLFGLLPRSLEQLGVRFFAMKVTATMTNVAGPAETRYLAGSRITRIMFGVPEIGGVTTGMSIMSYNGTIVVTLMTDAAIIPDPQELVDGFETEFGLLRERAAFAHASQAAAKATGNGHPPALAWVGDDGVAELVMEAR